MVMMMMVMRMDDDDDDDDDGDNERDDREDEKDTNSQVGVDPLMRQRVWEYILEVTRPDHHAQFYRKPEFNT